MTHFVKRAADAAALMLVIAPVFCYQVMAFSFGAERAFPGWSQLISLIPGLSGVYLRRVFYRCVLPSCGRDVCILFGTVFSHPTVRIGNSVYIGIGCILGDVTLGDDVLVGSHVSIINGRRQHGIERLDIPVREQSGEYPHIVIGEDSWIGDRAIVTANIGKHCVVGAGAVVTKAVADFAIVVGNPAIIKGFRKSEDATHGENGQPLVTITSAQVSKPDFGPT